MSLFGNHPMLYPQPLGLQDQQLTNNQMGTPVSYLAGTQLVSVTWISQVLGLQSFAAGGGKKSGKTGGGGPTTYNYFGNIGGGVGVGPVDALCGVIIDGESVWPQALAWSVGQTVKSGDLRTYDAQVWVALQGHTTSTVNAPGNASYWTEFTFTPADTGNAPAWVAGLIFNAGAYTNYGGNIYEALIANTATTGSSTSNAPPNSTYWRETTSSVLNSQPWKLGTAYVANQIVSYGRFFYICILANTAGAVSGGNQPGTGGGTWRFVGAAGAGYDEITVLIPNTGSSAKKNSVSAPTVYGTLRFYWGTQTAADPTLTTYQPHPAYVGMCYVVLVNWFLGQGVTNAPNLSLIIRKKPQQTVIADGGLTNISDGQANVAVIAAELLTNDNTLGADPSLIDTTSFTGVATALDVNASLTRGSALVDSQETIKALLDRIIDMTDGWFRFDAATGKIKMGLYPHGSAPGIYTQLNQNHLTERPQLKGTGWSQVMSRVTVQYNDRVLTFAQNSVKSDDPRAFQVLQQVRNSNVDRPWITRSAQAIAHAAETLRTVGAPQMTADITVRREIGRSILPGSYVLLDIDLEPNGESIAAFFRVKQRQIPQTGPIKFNLLRDPTLSPVVFTTTPQAALQQSTTVTPISVARVLMDDFDLTGEDNAVVVFAERPSTDALGFEVFFDLDDVNGLFPSLGVQTAYAIQGTPNAVGELDTTVTVDFAASVDQTLLGISPGAVGAADDELLLVLIELSSGAVALDPYYTSSPLVEVFSVDTATLVSGTTWTFSGLRNRLNSRLGSFSGSSTEAWLIFRKDIIAFQSSTLGLLRTNVNNSGTPTVGYFRVAPFTRSAELEVADITSLTFSPPPAKPEGPQTKFFGVTNNVLYTTSATPAIECNITGTQGIIFYAYAWLIPANLPFDIENPPAPTWSNDFGSGGPGYVWLEFNQSSSTYPTANRVNAITLTIPSSGTWKLIVAGQDLLNLMDQFDVLTIIKN